MCGRFAFYSPSEATAALFGVSGSVAVEPRYNIAPTQFIAAIREDEDRTRELVMLRWGLVPFWAKDPAIGNRMINARAETVAEKPSYRAAFRHRRCIVLADGFYEWRKEGDAKTPYFISLASGEPFGLAGLWENWKSPSGEWVRSCTIITTKPNAFMDPIHNRMPVILSEETEPLWLDPVTEDPDILRPLLLPSPAEEMESYQVSTYVNSPRNQGPECIKPVLT